MKQFSYLGVFSIQIDTKSYYSNQEAYMRLYNFDYKKACCSANDFDFKKLD